MQNKAQTWFLRFLIRTMLAISSHNAGGILLLSVSLHSGWFLSSLRQNCRKRDINIDKSNFSELEYFFMCLIWFSDILAFLKSLSLGSHVPNAVPGGMNESNLALRTRVESNTSLYKSKKFFSFWPNISVSIVKCKASILPSVLGWVQSRGWTLNYKH